MVSSLSLSFIINQTVLPERIACVVHLPLHENFATACPWTKLRCVTCLECSNYYNHVGCRLVYVRVIARYAPTTNMSLLVQYFDLSIVQCSFR
ncbi:hypothetical protein GW17_00012241 [Ensete ventricosum]|nr:hypothetical protein GW17_00012241 [Ensete ventricosum]